MNYPRMCLGSLENGGARMTCSKCGEDKFGTIVIQTITHSWLLCEDCRKECAKLIEAWIKDDVFDVSKITDMSIVGPKSVEACPFKALADDGNLWCRFTSGMTCVGEHICPIWNNPNRIYGKMGSREFFKQTEELGVTVPEALDELLEIRKEAKRKKEGEEKVGDEKPSNAFTRWDARFSFGRELVAEVLEQLNLEKEVVVKGEDGELVILPTKGNIKLVTNALYGWGMFHTTPKALWTILDTEAKR